MKSWNKIIINDTKSDIVKFTYKQKEFHATTVRLYCDVYKLCITTKRGKRIKIWGDTLKEEIVLRFLNEYISKSEQKISVQAKVKDNIYNSIRDALIAIDTKVLIHRKDFKLMVELGCLYDLAFYTINDRFSIELHNNYHYITVYETSMADPNFDYIALAVKAYDCYKNPSKYLKEKFNAN